MTLRKMEKNDLPALAELEKACFSDPWSEKMIENLLESPWDEVYVIEENAVIGYINYRFLAGEGELMRIAVLSAERGHGYSKLLMDAMMDAASKNGISDITLEVRAGNIPAIALYRSYGFVREAVRKGYYHDPIEDADIMWLRSIPVIPT